MAPKDQILVFGDQAVDLSSSFQKLNTLSKDCFPLSQLLQQASEALQKTFSQCSRPSEQVLFKSSLLDLCLNEKLEETRNVAVSTVLSCINQLGWLAL